MNPRSMLTCGAETEVHEQCDGVLERVVGQHVVILQGGHEPGDDVLLNHHRLLLPSGGKRPQHTLSGVKVMEVGIYISKEMGFSWVLGILRPGNN